MILLDTNIVIPLVEEAAERLPRAIANLLGINEPPFLVSTASLWEMAIKSRRGKLRMASPEEDWPSMCEALGMALLPVLPSHAVRSVDPWPDTNDPFDRLLLSVCDVEQLRLVTIDEKLSIHPLAWRA